MGNEQSSSSVPSQTPEKTSSQAPPAATESLASSLGGAFNRMRSKLNETLFRSESSSSSSSRGAHQRAGKVRMNDPLLSAGAPGQRSANQGIPRLNRVDSDGDVADEFFEAVEDGTLRRLTAVRSTTI